MGFFDRHKTADTKTAEEQSKAEMDALVDRLGASLEERIAKPLGDRIDKLQSEWEAVKTEATKTPPADTTPRNADGTPRELTDEEKNRNASQATIALAVATNARLTESEVISQIAGSWPDQVAEIRSYFANTPIQRKAQPDYAEYCGNIVDMVIGKAAKKAGFRYDRDGKTFFLEDKSTSTTPEGPLSDPGLAWQQRDANGNIKRTWSAADQLRALDIDPKQFEENMKKGVV